MSKSPSQRKTLHEWVGVAGKKEVMLTIAYVDIVGSTQLLNQLGNERMEQWALEPFFAQAQRLCKRYDGFIVKRIGDAVLVAFRTPTDGLDFLLAFLANPGRDILALRAGMDVGQVILKENDVTGQAVHYAARLEAIAEASTVLMSDRAQVDIRDYRAARHDHLLFNPKSCPVRGFEGDHYTLWSVECPHRRPPLLAVPAAKSEMDETSTNGVVHLS